MQINTAAGPVDVDRLGKTLMHEHLVIGFPGWESDTAHASPSFREMTAVCLDRIGELKAAGFSTLLTPAPTTSAATWRRWRRWPPAPASTSSSRPGWRVDACPR